MKSKADIGGGGERITHLVNLLQKGVLEATQETYHQLLKKCTALHRPDQGRIIHAHLLSSSPTLTNNAVIHNSLLHMYSVCASLPQAHAWFHKIPSKNIVTWTILITAYSHTNSPNHAFLLLPQLLRSGLTPNPSTLSTLLKAAPHSLPGLQLHTLSLKSGHLSNLYVSSSLLHMYCRHGLLPESDSLFRQLVCRNEVSWNALIAGHARKNGGGDAMGLFCRMLRENLRPTSFTYSTMLTSCASMGALEPGKWVHVYMVKFNEKLNPFVGNALLNMYAKSGMIDDAWRVFHRILKRDLVSWNSMLSGLAHHGLGRDAVNLFQTMLDREQEEEEKGNIHIIPNGVSFLCLLTACSNAGLVKEGKEYFNMMRERGGMVKPGGKHYAAMVGLLGRAKLFEEAMRLIEGMGVEEEEGRGGGVWGALLGACVVHRNVELGGYAGGKVVEGEPGGSGGYVLMAKLCGWAGRWEEVGGWRKVMKRRGVKKEPACSWVEIENVVHFFVACDDSHPEIDEIKKEWMRLWEKIKEIGYEEEEEEDGGRSNVFLLDSEEEEERRLRFHSEKLALGFAVMKMGAAGLIRIMKNIRVCGDCHSAFKFVSKLLGREIVLRDCNRFHRFFHGSCSCRDYW